MQNGAKLVIAIAMCLMVGLVASRFTASQIGTWYPTILKPDWNPPRWIFFPVWTTLYVMMGVAFFMVWKNPVESHAKTRAIIFFALQLLFNFMWSIIFFRFHAIGWAFVDIVLLWLTILLTIGSFYPISRTAAWLLVPYAAWVTFASILTYTIMVLNP